jgi:hypothetical protein
MNLKDRIEIEILDHGDRKRIESIDIRCLCETIAICFQALIDSIEKLTINTNINTLSINDKLDEFKESIDPDPRNPAFR